MYCPCAVTSVRGQGNRVGSGHEKFFALGAGELSIFKNTPLSCTCLRGGRREQWNRDTAATAHRQHVEIGLSLGLCRAASCCVAQLCTFGAS